MALREMVLPQGRQNRLGVAQQPQLVCDGGLAQPHPQGRLLLAQTIEPHEPFQALGLLDVVQVPPLEILYQGQHAALQLVAADHDAGYLPEPSQPGRPEPPFPGHQLIIPVPAADSQRLQHPELHDGLGELLQGLLLKDLPRLARVGPDQMHRQIHHPAGFKVALFPACHCASPPLRSGSDRSILEPGLCENRGNTKYCGKQILAPFVATWGRICYDTVT